MQAWEEPISSRGSYRYIMSKDTDQFSRMINIKRKKKKNMIILPQLVSPHDHHQLHSYGYGDIFFSDVPMLQTDNKNILNANEISSFSMDSNLYNQQDQQLDEALAFFPQLSINNYQYSAASAVPSMESVDQHCPSFYLNMMTSPTLPRCDYDDINTIIHKQKQQQEQLLSRDPLKLIKETSIMGNFQGNNCSKRKRGRIPEEKPSENDWKSNKKRAAAVVCCRQEQSQEYQFLKDIKEVHRAPVRKSKKLADRVTALQKLVSPYGKTDTASVLYEASIFIEVLQDQIQNIFNSLPDSKSTQQKNTTTGEGKELDLRNKGLCLVPVWLTQKFVEEGMEEEDGFRQYCFSS